MTEIGEDEVEMESPKNFQQKFSKIQIQQNSKVKVKDKKKFKFMRIEELSIDGTPGFKSLREKECLKSNHSKQKSKGNMKNTHVLSEKWT